MNFESLVKHISTIQSAMQAQTAHAVNLALTARNWLMGCYIVEFEQNGEDRAAYGEQLLKKLEQRLNVKGLSERRFREFRRLYLVYPQLKDPITQYILSRNEIWHSQRVELIEPIRRMPSAESEYAQKWMIPADKLFHKLTYSNLMLISMIDNPVKRAFYEMETIRGCWSYKELERQINSLYYERSGLSKNKEALSALILRQTAPLQPKDVINTPITLEFLGLSDRALVTESDLEQSILDNLQCYDCIVPYASNLEAIQIASPYEDWVRAIPGVHIDDLILLEEYMKSTHPEQAMDFNSYLNSPRKLMYHIFITKPETFKKYCAWLFDILFKVEPLIDTSLYSTNGKRTLGYLAEILYGFYFTQLQKEYRVKECGVAFIDK